MARYTCQRCGQECFTLAFEANPDGDPIITARNLSVNERNQHLCKDLVRRQARQQAQVKAVEDILWDDYFAGRPASFSELAEVIVTALNRAGITEDA